MSCNLHILADGVSRLAATVVCPLNDVQPGLWRDHVLRVAPTSRTTVSSNCARIRDRGGSQWSWNWDAVFRVCTCSTAIDPYDQYRIICLAISIDSLPRTPQVFGTIDLEQPAVADVANLHERRGEQHDIRRVEANALGSSLPLDRPHVSIRVSVTINKESERIIDEQELALGRAEYAQRPSSCFASRSESAKRSVILYPRRIKDWNRPGVQPRVAAG